MIVVHDFAYADVGFDGYRPPSILQADGAKECAVELYSMTKSFSMAGWRVAFLSGNADVVAALVKLKTLPRLRHVPADPDRRHRHHERGPRLPAGGVLDLPEPARRPVRRAGPHRLGHPQAGRHDVRVGAHPRALPGAGLGRVRVDAGAGVRGGHVARRRASAPAATASCASPSSRTSSASPRASATCAGASRSWLSRPTTLVRPRSHDAVTALSHCRHDPVTAVATVRRDAHYVVRVWLPDRPGALGQVASRIGAVRGDVVGIEILERGAGRAIDELVVALPDDGLVDLLVAEIGQVDGVDVEDVRAVVGAPARRPAERRWPSPTAWSGPTTPTSVLRGLCERPARDFECDWGPWSASTRRSTMASLGEAPSAAWVAAFLRRAPATSSRPTTRAARPADLAWAELPASRPGAGRRAAAAAPSAAGSAASWPSLARVADGAMVTRWASARRRCRRRRQPRAARRVRPGPVP